MSAISWRLSNFMYPGPRDLTLPGRIDSCLMVAEHSCALFGFSMTIKCGNSHMLNRRIWEIWLLNFCLAKQPSLCRFAASFFENGAAATTTTIRTPLTTIIFTRHQWVASCNSETILRPWVQPIMYAEIEWRSSILRQGQRHRRAWPRDYCRFCHCCCFHAVPGANRLQCAFIQLGCVSLFAATARQSAESAVQRLRKRRDAQDCPWRHRSSRWIARDRGRLLLGNTETSGRDRCP